MSSSVQEDYLRSQVLTASPQKLQLMMIEAAIRHAQQGRNSLELNEGERAVNALVKAQEIIAELIGAIEPAPDSALANRVKANYLFVHQSLVSGNLHRRIDPIDGALRVLQIERDTWQRLCQQTPTAPPAGRGAAGGQATTGQAAGQLAAGAIQTDTATTGGQSTTGFASYLA